MKRVSLMLDEKLLESATKLLGAKTYSATVNLALAEALRVKKVMGLSKFFGQNLWEGNLSELRGDKPSSRKRRSNSRCVSR